MNLVLVVLVLVLGSALVNTKKELAAANNKVESVKKDRRNLMLENAELKDKIFNMKKDIEELSKKVPNEDVLEKVNVLYNEAMENVKVLECEYENTTDSFGFHADSLKVVYDLEEKLLALTFGTPCRAHANEKEAMVRNYVAAVKSKIELRKEKWNLK